MYSSVHRLAMAARLHVWLQMLTTSEHRAKHDCDDKMYRRVFKFYLYLFLHTQSACTHRKLYAPCTHLKLSAP